MTRRALLALAVLALAWPAPRGAHAQVPAEIRQAAADRVWIREYLRLYDQTLTMQAALGQITGAQADAQLAAAGHELYDQGFYEQDMGAVREALRAAATPFLAGIEREIASSTSWPGDMPAEAYRSLSTRLLSYTRTELNRMLARGADPTPALRAATLVLAWARGYEGLPEDLDYFAGTRARAAGAVPGIDLMPIEGGAAPALPPPPGLGIPAGGPRVNPTTPAAGGAGGAPAGGGRGGLVTSVLLRAGMVEGQARFLGESDVDVVGKTTRPRGDGAPDTEIELRILARGFVIENIEVRNEPTGGRMVDRALGTWSSRPASRRPLVGVMANRGLLNRANGELGAIALNDVSILNLYIQDDGQLAASAEPGTVVVYFRGGERAAFPILVGAAPATLGAGGRPTPPAGGAGGAPPGALTGLPPRTPAAPGGRPGAPPPGTGVTIPRNQPPPMPGGVPPVTRPPAGTPTGGQPGVTRPPAGTPTGGGPAIRPPITPPVATMPAGGGAGRPPVTPPAVSQPPAQAGGSPARLASFQARWVGMDADVVSKGSEARPDGSADGHFQITATFSAWQDITHVALYSSDASGAPAGGQVWHSQNAGYWLFAALANGMNLNVRHLPTLGKFNGTVTLDLYAGDSGWFTAGRTFLVEMGMGPGQAVAQVVQVGAGGAAPPVTPPVTPPIVTGGGGGGAPAGATTTDYGTSPGDHRGQNGQRFSYPCPPGGSARTIWGTGVYTDDSSICTAAVHAGLITFAAGGTVTIEIRPGENSYTGSPGYGGVTSSNYGAWPGSFAFAGAGGAVPPTTVAFNGAIQTDRASYAPGETITVTFTNFPGTNDWIAIAPAGAAPESYGEWHWTDRRTSGTLTFTAPAAGSYEARVFVNWDAGGYNVRAMRPFTVTPAGPTFASLPADWPPTWQWESQGGWTGTWTRRGTSDVFDAAYHNGGTRVTTVEEMTWSGQQVHVRRVSSTDNILCTLEGTIRSTTTIEGTGACPASTSGWWWRLTVAAAPPGVDTATPGTNAVPVRGQNGSRFQYYCPPNSATGTVWGTDYYTDDSAICAAAVHAGAIAAVTGGTVMIEIRPGQTSYQGSPRNGINSNNYGAWSGSFVIVGAGGAVPPPTFAGAVTTDRPTYARGETITVRFTGFPGTNDWIAIAPRGASPESYGEWKWTDGSATSGRPAGSPQRDGTLTFTAPADGEYEVRAFIDYPNGGYTVRASSPFTVLPGGGPPAGNACGRTLGTGIFNKWQSLGGEGGFLGCPTMDEADAAPSPQGTTGRWASFAGNNGLIVWMRSGQAYEVHGDISVLYYGMGGSASWLGFPTSDEYDVTGGRRSDFEGGYILWTAATGETKAYPYGQGPPATFAGQIYADRQSYASGETITVTFTNFPGTNDWIAIAPVGASPEQYGEWHWTEQQTAGTMTFTAPAAGSYELRAYANWPDAGYTVVATVPIQVGGGAAGGGAACDISGSWAANQPSFGASTWTFTPTGSGSYSVQESGLGNATGSAVMSGYRIQIEWQTGGWSGTIVVDVDGSCTSASGQNVIRTGSPGNYPITFQRGGAQAGGGYPQDLLVAYDAAWVGMDVDGVGAGGAGPPDGAADGHFTFDIDINTNYEVRYISVYSTDAQGTPAGGQVWTTQSSAYWPLAVYLQGTRLNDGHVASLGTHSGYRHFDLAAANSGYFNDGQYFVVEADVGFSEPLRRLVQVTGAGGGAAAGGGGGAGAGAGGGDGIHVYANQGTPVQTPVLEAGRWYILEVQGTITVWGDTDTDKIDAVYCYNCDARSGEHWAQLQVDGHGLSDYSAAAGGPSPIPYDPSHVYRVYIQGQGRPVSLVVADAAAGSGGDNSGEFTVRITTQEGQPVGGGGQQQGGQPLEGQPQGVQPQGGQLPSGTFQGRWQIYSCVDASGADAIGGGVINGTLSVALDGQGSLSGVLSVSLSLFGEAARDYNLPYTGSYDARTLYGIFNSRNGGSIQMTGDYTFSGGTLSMPSVTLEARDPAGGVTRCAGSAAFP